MSKQLRLTAASAIAFVAVCISAVTACLDLPEIAKIQGFARCTRPVTATWSPQVYPSDYIASLKASGLFAKTDFSVFNPVTATWGNPETWKFGSSVFRNLPSMVDRVVLDSSATVDLGLTSVLLIDADETAELAEISLGLGTQLELDDGASIQFPVVVPAVKDTTEACLDFALDLHYIGRALALSGQYSAAAGVFAVTCDMSSSTSSALQALSTAACKTVSALADGMGLFNQPPDRVATTTWDTYKELTALHISAIADYEEQIRFLQTLAELRITNSDIRNAIASEGNITRAEIKRAIAIATDSINSNIDAGFQRTIERVEENKQILLEQGAILRQVQTVVLDNQRVLNKMATDFEGFGRQLQDVRAQSNNILSAISLVGARVGTDGSVKGWDINGDNKATPLEVGRALFELRQFKEGDASQLPAILDSALGGAFSSTTAALSRLANPSVACTSIRSAGIGMLGAQAWGEIESRMKLGACQWDTNGDLLVSVQEAFAFLKRGDFFEFEGAKMWDLANFEGTKEAVWESLVDAASTYIDDALRRLASKIPSESIKQIAEKVIGVVATVKAGIQVIAPTITSCKAVVAGVAAGPPGIVLSLVTGVAGKCITGIKDSLKFIFDHRKEIVNGVIDVGKAIVNAAKKAISAAAKSVKKFFKKIFRRGESAALRSLREAAAAVDAMDQTLDDLKAMDSSIDRMQQDEQAIFDGAVPTAGFDSVPIPPERLRAYIEAAIGQEISGANATANEDAVAFTNAVLQHETAVRGWYDEALRSQMWEMDQFQQSLEASVFVPRDYDIETVHRILLKKRQSIMFLLLEVFARQVQQYRFEALDASLYLNGFTLSVCPDSQAMRAIASTIESAHLKFLEGSQRRQDMWVSRTYTADDQPLTFARLADTGGTSIFVPVPSTPGYSRVSVIDMRVFVYPLNLTRAESRTPVNIRVQSGLQSPFYDANGNLLTFTHAKPLTIETVYRPNDCASSSSISSPDAVHILRSPYGAWNMRLQHPDAARVLSKARTITVLFRLAFDDPLGAWSESGLKSPDPLMSFTVDPTADGTVCKGPEGNVVAAYQLALPACAVGTPEHADCRCYARAPVATTAGAQASPTAVRPSASTATITARSSSTTKPVVPTSTPVQGTYTITVETSTEDGAATAGPVYCVVYGTFGTFDSGPIQIANSLGAGTTWKFQRAGVLVDAVMGLAVYATRANDPWTCVSLKIAARGVTSTFVCPPTPIGATPVFLPRV